ncbi:putative FAD-linked oxidoreductase [Caulifigura coniformis]|uniref:Putative FAD-linked oxidoreductase n=1 Tax=Caulifigura coniformis TaxID=2527983 RepID=A0A517S9Q0_9PLAN|nr:FAD-binding oxidoreductase [Caulifigura coniformis]QDT52858.1 putative FAD-linked oxidoreductase [Caulifigura coniformis]
MSATAEEFAPASTSELARFLAANAAQERAAVVPAGGRTSLRMGDPVIAPARLISISTMQKVVDYPARDMTITVESGIRFADLQKILAAEGQRLPIDVPDAHRATLGGAIAANTSGPRRLGQGTFRDYVIGISAVDGIGRPFSAGGRVVKNVAGYDLCKLLVGSLGTLAVITQVTLKLRPVAEALRVLWLTAETAEQIEAWLVRLGLSETRPTVVEVVNRRAIASLAAESRVDLPAAELALAVAFEGSTEECDWQMAAVEKELGPSPGAVRLADPQSALLLRALGEFQAAGDDPVTFSASVPSSRVAAFVMEASRRGVTVQAHAINGIVIGHLPDECVTAGAASEIITPLRKSAESVGGSLVVWNCDDAWKPTLNVFGTPQPTRRWMKEVKNALDPHGVLSPGRLPA